MTFAYYEVEQGADVHDDHLANEEVRHVIDGELELLTLGTEARTVGAGQAAIVAAYEPHRLLATRPTRAIVVDYPVRSSVGGIQL
jgi:quercetin dioxygenase-like cupin family protein